MNCPDLRSILEFAVESAQLAGAHTLGHFNARTPVEWKADRSPVTAADRGAEERLRARIEKQFPAHGILGEEFGEKPGSTPGRWILDPIDGTFSFIHGVPLYSVLIGFEWQGEVVAGVIHMPALRETVYAARGLGCFWDGRRAHVSDVEALSDATLLTGGGAMFDRSGRAAEFDRMRRACRVHRSWCDGYAYALVATGRAEVVFDPVMAIWDAAAVLPVIQEAGGRVSDWRGGVTHTANELIATNGRLHAAALAVLAGGT
ncbi:MAG: inositol monophosphatase family protein [Phycisphaerales bacterium]|nr:inositol monophosphatase family protein [Phycisphaerales bacterium]